MKASLFLASALLCSSMAMGNDFRIRLSTGKSKYVPEEPIYFKLILSNASKKFIGYGSPISIGIGSFTFCEEISKRCVQDADVMNQALKAPMVGNFAPGKTYRIFGTLNSGQVRFLMGTKPGRKVLTVKPTLVGDAEIKKQSSEPWPIEIVPGNPEDDSVAAKLKRFGNQGLRDNANGSGIPPSGFPPEGKKKALEEWIHDWQIRGWKRSKWRTRSHSSPVHAIAVREVGSP